jgi:hypothetical protein
MVPARRAPWPRRRSSRQRACPGQFARRSHRSRSLDAPLKIPRELPPRRPIRAGRSTVSEAPGRPVRTGDPWLSQARDSSAKGSRHSTKDMSPGLSQRKNLPAWGHVIRARRCHWRCLLRRSAERRRNQKPGPPRRPLRCEVPAGTWHPHDRLPETFRLGRSRRWVDRQRSTASPPRRSRQSGANKSVPISANLASLSLQSAGDSVR